MHFKRWITAIVALPLVILLICKGGSILFAIFICIVCMLALAEYFRIVFNIRGKSECSNSFSFQILAYVFGLMIILAAYINSFDIIFGLIILNLILSGLISLSYFKTNPSVIELTARQVLGIIYIPLFLSCMVLIRNDADGIAWIFFLLVLVFAGDTGAFYVGRLFGRHKLCPAVSPGKTIEGAIGGLTATLGAGLIFMNYFLKSLPLWPGILFFLSIGVVGQVGDLFESELKRYSGVKDSGSILPGHGGILDRIDALLFAAPVAYFFKEYILL
ncbi:MAG: phosphatidate cytidylyltransferase [Desulfobacterales bacterium]|uniref:Phosphatidate cytidylyltransferase n=1 Tax=Candidatus Desulfaltia bathyphila TaxID=2841697 RepID=A0A8J6N4S9_9BACT|nr:phosphatidate cytidylyltransferase [Candidatus Desulfaltia bathyphila]MBL7195150.1 phosphatidate cytidylyltransferase [Desulfobacterales bacterium]MBL7207887.1 phosphatidate cytidylyltransferase [Desulfobacterales bacterium]